MNTKKRTKKVLFLYGGNTMNITNDILNETHLLIAGCTGSGKSVLLNNIIINLYNSDNKFIFIDIKKVELSQYKNTIQCINYCETSETVIIAMEKAVQDIEKRFKHMQKKNLKLYPGNNVYIVIDELADLLTDNNTRKEILPLLCRVGQIGRAAKYHLIACTQIPNRNIISSQLRVNFTGIIGLRTAGQRETINILGGNTIQLHTFPKYGQAVYLSQGKKHLFKFGLYSQDKLDLIVKRYNKSLIKSLFDR